LGDAIEEKQINDLSFLRDIDELWILIRCL
jgi:hypothetical protein